MASVTNLSKGSSGSEVKKLQEALINAGYDVGKTGADGVLGKNTEAAIKAYQKDNGLTVDGIAGKNTQGLLYSTKTTTPASNAGSKNNAGSKSNAGNASKDAAGTNTATTPASNTGSKSNAGNASKDTAGTNTTTTASGFTYDNFTYNPYAKSDAVNEAFAVIDDLKANAPGAWTDPYADKYMGYLNQYENRDPFSYDFNSDALYQQYKDQYIQQGQMAMMDTMGQAAAMTGGYGNSYAQTVGQQAYNQQLSQLNEIMPELYQMAYNRYNQEGQDMLNMYNAYLGLSDKSYNQYQDTVDRYYNDLGIATDYAFGLQNMDFNEWQANTNMAFNVWNAETGMNFDDYQALINRQFTSEENEKDRQHTSEENEKNRSFTESENKKDRAAAAANAAAKSSYGTLNTEDTMSWIKKFESAEDLDTLESYTTALQGIIGPEAAAIWYDTYSKKFLDKDDDDKLPETRKPTAGGGGGVNYMTIF